MTLYLNNAGTSWPKPDPVLAAVARVQAAAPDTWPQELAQAHATVTEFFSMPEPSRFLFTTGCTSALAVAIGDMAWQSGDRVLMSAQEHHALARPIIKLARERGIEFDVIPYRPGVPLDLDMLSRSLRAGRVRLVACTMASTVPGECLPVAEVIELAHAHDALCLIDGAQTAGLFDIDLSRLNPDIFVFAGHKGPQAPQGVGGLYAASRVPMESPAAACELRLGEAGTTACSPFPSYCDVGSVNLAAVAGLAAGLSWLKQYGRERISDHLRQITAHLIDGLSDISGVTIHGICDVKERTTAVSISIRDTDLQAVANHLRQRANVIVSAGHQCAPMAHESLGTAAQGTLRISPGLQTSTADIDRAIKCLHTAISATRP